MTIKDLSESIIAGAQEGHDVNDDLLALAEALTKNPPSEADRALSMEAASWFVGQRVAGAALYMAESFLQISANLDAAKFLRTITRRKPFNEYKPLLALKAAVESGTRHSYSYPDWVETHNAMPPAVARALGPCEQSIFAKVLSAKPTKLLSIFSGDGVLEEALLEALPELHVHFAELTRFDNRLAELQFKFPERVTGHLVGGRYDFGRDTHDVCILHRLDIYSDLSATLAYAYDRAPLLFTYALYSTRWPPLGQVDTPTGSRYVALHSLDQDEIRLMFGSLGIDPSIQDIDGVLLAEAKLEVSDVPSTSAKPDSTGNPTEPGPAGPGPENSSPK